LANADLLFAKSFLTHRINGHRKDVAICMCGYRMPHDGRLTHAYFPALMITIGFADLLAGLHAGRIENHGRTDLQRYFDDFMDRSRYSKDAIDVLYEGFRHKVAHLGHPYAIFDTRTKPKVFPLQKRYAWTVYASVRPKPLCLIDYATPRKVGKSPVPWPMSYDARIQVSVRSLSKDLVTSVFKPMGYFSRLKSDSQSLARFMDCMEDFYPR
jgi:hypothetical protein